MDASSNSALYNGKRSDLSVIWESDLFDEPQTVKKNMDVGPWLHSNCLWIHANEATSVNTIHPPHSGHEG